MSIPIGSITASQLPVFIKPTPTTASMVSFASNNPQAKGAQGMSKRPRFAGDFNNDWLLMIRPFIPLTPLVLDNLRRELIIQDLRKRNAGDTTSSLKLMADTVMTSGRSVLADTMLLMDRPVDVLVKEISTVQGLPTLLGATGKRFMYPSATVATGPIKGGTMGGRVSTQKVILKLQQDGIQDMKTMIMDRTGKTDPKEVAKDLDRNQPWNALEALWYGKNGLVDAVLMPGNKVITRQDLQTYYTANGIVSPGDIEAFNQNRNNIYKIPLTTGLETFSPNTLPTQTDPAYQSLTDLMANQLKSKRKWRQLIKKLAANPQAGLPGFHIFHQEGPMVSMEHATPAKQYNILDSQDAPRTQIVGLPKGLKSLLYRDTITMNDIFHPLTVSQVTKSLFEADSKKQQALGSGASAVSNISLMLNSPGGSVSSGYELKDTIAQMKTPVDVTVNGKALSCGALLLNLATGNRFATPNSRIMLHQASTGEQGDMTQGHLEDHVDSLDKVYDSLAEVFSQSTGRPKETVLEDLSKEDGWFTPLDALLYGPKGLIDGVLVGDGKVVTRDILNQYLLEHFGQDQTAVNDYVETRIQKRLTAELPKARGRSLPAVVHEDEDNGDPLDNPLRVIRELAKIKAVPLEQVSRFKSSLPTDAETSMDLYHMREFPKQLMFG